MKPGYGGNQDMVETWILTFFSQCIKIVFRQFEVLNYMHLYSQMHVKNYNSFGVAQSLFYRGTPRINVCKDLN